MQEEVAFQGGDNMEQENLVQQQILAQKIEKKKGIKINNRFKCLCKKKYIQPWLLAQYKEQQIKFPLRSLTHTVQLTEGIAQTTIEQVYVNEYDQLLEGIYKFQIDDNQCYKSLICEYDGQIIEGKIEEKQKAKKQYQENKELGNTVVLAEKDEEDDEKILKMKIGNIQPQTEIKITLVYLQNLKVFQNKFYNYNLPYGLSLCQDHSDESENKQEQVKNANPVEKNQKLMPKCQFIVNSINGVEYFKSLNHEIIEQTKIEQNLVMYNLKIDNDKDICIFYRSQNIERPKVILGENEHKQVCAQLTFVPDINNANIDDAMKQCLDNQNDDFEIQNQKKQFEITFVLDQSGSMSGTAIQKAKEALVFFLKSLPSENCNFNICSFGTKFKMMFDKQMDYNEQNVELALQKIQELKADMGGTDIYKPLESIFKNAQKQAQNLNKKRIVYLLTDGQVRDENSVVKLITQNNELFNVHTIGIGNSVSLSLVQRAATAGKGENILIRDVKNMAGKIIELLDNSLSNLIEIRNVDYSHEYVENFINPNYNLKMNQPFTCYLFLKQTLEELKNMPGFLVRIKFFNNIIQQEIEYKLDVNFNTKEDNQQQDEIRDDCVYYLGVNERINEMIKKEEDNEYVKFEDHIVKLSVQNQILSKYTAFICIAKYLNDEQRPQIMQLGEKVIQAEKPVYLEQNHIHDNLFGVKKAQIQRRSMMAQQLVKPGKHGRAKQINMNEACLSLNNFAKRGSAMNSQMPQMSMVNQSNNLRQDNSQMSIGGLGIKKKLKSKAIQNYGQQELSIQNVPQLHQNIQFKQQSHQFHPQLQQQQQQQQQQQFQPQMNMAPMNLLSSNTQKNNNNNNNNQLFNSYKEQKNELMDMEFDEDDNDSDDEQELEEAIDDNLDMYQQSRKQDLELSLSNGSNERKRTKKGKQLDQKKKERKQSCEKMEEEESKKQEQNLDENEEIQSGLAQIQEKFWLSTIFKKNYNKQQNKNYKLVDLISSQSIKGYWNFNCDELLYILKCSSNFAQNSDLNQICNTLNQFLANNVQIFEKIQEKNMENQVYANLWMTLFVLTWLEKYQNREKTAWSLIAKKAHTWINSQGIKADEFKNAIGEFL